MNREEIYDYCKKKVKTENSCFIYTEFENKESEINKYNIDNYKNNIFKELFIRTIHNKNIGIYKLQDINKKNIDDAISKTKKQANLKKTDVVYKEFGKCKTNKKMKFDKNIENHSFSNILNEVKKNITKEKYVKGYFGGVSKSKKYSFYINPNTEKEVEKYFIGQYTEILTKNKKKSSGSFYSVYTKEKDINISENIEQAKINSKILLDPVDGKKDEYTVILTPEVTKTILNFILSGGSGEIIQKKNSFLHNQINKQIFSKKLNINEEPNLDYFLRSDVFDDEGIKTKEKEIIKDGCFKKPIYNLYSSIKYNKKPTGNSFLYNGFGVSYTNKIQKAGTEKIEDVISKTKKGILVYSVMGMHTNKLTTGDFSLTISIGKKIENGSFKETITNLNFTGNFKSILKEAYFSKEQKFFGNSLFSFTIIPKTKLI